MGDDFSNHQVFAAGGSPFRRDQLVAELHSFLGRRGFVAVGEDRDEVDRRIAIGPIERWICIYDSAGNGDDQDLLEFELLSLHLSTLVPVVDIHMSDSCSLHLYLYRDGKKSDQFADSLGVGVGFESEEHEASFRGRAELWADLLPSSDSTDELQRAWQQNSPGSSLWQRRSSDSRLSATATLLGWHPWLYTVGYTIDYDGIPVYYQEHFRDDPVDLTGFTEYYFVRQR